MESQSRHVFRPQLESLEDRLVPSFSWGVGRGAAALLAAAHPPAASQPAPGLSMPAGPTEVVSAPCYIFHKMT
jgi:hypothetical protein